MSKLSDFEKKSRHNINESLCLVLSICRRLDPGSLFLRNKFVLKFDGSHLICTAIVGSPNTDLNKHYTYMGLRSVFEKSTI